eukprot:3408738-Rhodomonas_salina.1
MVFQKRTLCSNRAKHGMPRVARPHPHPPSVSLRTPCPRPQDQLNTYCAGLVEFHGGAGSVEERACGGCPEHGFHVTGSLQTTTALAFSNPGRSSIALIITRPGERTGGKPPRTAPPDSAVVSHPPPGFGPILTGVCTEACLGSSVCQTPRFAACMASCPGTSQRLCAVLAQVKDNECAESPLTASLATGQRGCELHAVPRKVHPRAPPGQCSAKDD